MQLVVAGLDGAELPVGLAVVDDDDLVTAAAVTDTYALAYPYPPAALQLEPGARFTSWSDAVGLPLPVPLAASRLTADGWAPVDVTSEAWARFRRPEITVEACQLSGGCVAGDDPLRCRIPCAVDDPASPTRPQRACPAGWTGTPTDEPGVEMCRPAWPDRAACGPFEWQPFEDAACRPLSACPAGRWPEVPPGPALYVEAGGQGDGRPEAPFGRIADAVAQATPGTTIVLGAGEWREQVVLQTDDVTLLGRCPESTRIQARRGHALRVEAVGVRVRGVHAASEDNAALRATETSSVTVADSRLQGVALGVRAQGRVTLDTVRVEGGVTGIRTDAGRFVARRVDVTARADIVCSAGASLTLEDVTLRQVGPETNEHALALAGCGDVSIRGAFLKGGNRRVLVGAAYASLLLEDVKVEVGTARVDAVQLTPGDTFETADVETTLRRVAVHGGQHGMFVVAGNLVATDLYLERQEQTAIRILGTVASGTSGADVRGLWVRQGASGAVTLDRPLSYPAGYALHLTDVVVDDMVPRTDREPLFLVWSDQRLTLERAWLDLPGKIGLQVACADEVVVRDVTMVGQGSTGFWLEPVVAARIERVDVRADLLFGLEARFGDSCDPGPVVVSDARLHGLGRGQGILAQAGVSLRGRRLDVRAFATGLEAGAESTLDIVDARVVDNREGVAVPADFPLAEGLRRAVLDNGRDVVRR